MSPKKSATKSKASSGDVKKGSVTRHLEAQYGKTFTEAELIDGLSEDLRDAWKKLRAFAVTLGTQRIYASAQSIMFAKKVCYFYVSPRKTALEVWIFLPHKLKGLTFMQGPGKKVKYCNLFKAVHPDQIEEPLTDWLREAFEFAAHLGDCGQRFGAWWTAQDCFVT